MLTDPILRSQVDRLWDMLWTGGLTNPMDAIEQFSYLLFFKRLDDEENRRERQANLRGQPFTPYLPATMRWGHWTHFQAEKALAHIKEQVFPWFKNLGEKGSSFERYMQNAEFKINKPSLLIEACKLIDQMRISEQNQDVQGDLYEYMLSHLNTAGRNGQFRTPRHIIRMMVQMIAPRPGERIGDMAAGTCGFHVNAYQYILQQHTSPEILEPDPTGQGGPAQQGWGHPLIGDRLTDAQRAFLQTEAFQGYDNDSGMTMLRIGSMNMMLHGIAAPRFDYMDTLSKRFTEADRYQVILMNPPFKGAVDKADVHPQLPENTRKSELLFLHLILRVLDSGGRCAVIVPDGVLFGSSAAHVEIRKALVEQHRLDGVVSMPGGVFKPYAGVSTAVLLFTKNAATDRIWYYDMAHDGFSLDDKRTPTAENDIPDILDCWQHRHDPTFHAEHAQRRAVLEAQLTPLCAERLRLEGELNRLTFESVIADNGELERETPLLDAAQQALNDLDARMAPLKSRLNRLSRQFWVTKKQVKANKYDLSASRYRQTTPESVYYEQPDVTLARLTELEQVINGEIEALKKAVDGMRDTEDRGQR